MKTYPQRRPDGSVHSFEISNFLVTRQRIRAILRAVPAVADVELARDCEDRLRFRFHERPCLVTEPYGDNSRYWIGIENADDPLGLDLGPVERAFIENKGVITKLLGRVLLSAS